MQPAGPEAPSALEGGPQPASDAPGKPLSVMHINTARTWRGAERQVLQTVTRLVALGQRVCLAAPPQGELFGRMPPGSDLIAISPRYEGDPRQASRLARAIRQRRPDIVHAHDSRGVAATAMALSISPPVPPPILVVSRRVMRPIARNPFSRWKYRKFSCYIAISEAVRQSLIASGTPAASITRIYSGVDVEHIARQTAANIHAAFGFPAGSPVVGNIAALTDEKGHDDLIDAAAIVVKAIPTARFVICGEGDLRPRLQERIRARQLEGRVILAGFRKDVFELLKAFDLFVISSLREGLCSSLIDAMAASRAAVATRVGGIPEVVADGETGSLVPPSDPRAMAARIIQLLQDDKLRERMGTAGLGRARELFDVSQMVRRTLETYRKVLAKRAVA